MSEPRRRVAIVGEEEPAGRARAPAAPPARVVVAANRDEAPPMLDRALQRAIARHERVRPAFSGSWVTPEVPEEAEVVAAYDIPGCRVQLCRFRAGTEGLYHITPEEYALGEDELALLLKARAELSSDFPESLELTNVSQTRAYVTRRAGALLADLHEQGKAPLAGSSAEVRLKLARLARILARHTVGYGVLEIFLTDPRVSDVYVNAPAPTTPVRVTLHTQGLQGMPQKCRTNVYLAKVDEDSLLSRLRYESGRPFSEAFPVLEADIPSFGSRATLVGPPLSPHGIAVAIRRHAPSAWTLLRLIDAGAMSPLAAGLVSTLVQGQSTIIVAGGRGAGKTSLLSALLFEIPPGQRILTVEDTPEIPILTLQQNGYQAQALGVRSSMGGAAAMSASDALRVALRLGESAIVMGEVRGEEAKTLYEAMRAGTAGSAVLGTFHADSASAVFQRVVYDLGIDANSFAATDAVVVAGTVKRGGSNLVARRLLQVAEFDRAEPSAGRFRDLLRYDAAADAWDATDELQRGSSLLARIGERWGMSYFDVMRLVEARASVYGHVVRRARELNKPGLLSASAVPRIASAFQEQLESSSGRQVDHDGVVARVTQWFEKEMAAR